MATDLLKKGHCRQPYLEGVGSFSFGGSMNYWSVFFSGFLGLGVVCLVIPLTLKFWHRLELAKREQDLHHTPGSHIPRLGVLALAVAFVAIEVFCWILYPQSVL